MEPVVYTPYSYHSLPVSRRIHMVEEPTGCNHYANTTSTIRVGGEMYVRVVERRRGAYRIG